MGKNAVENNLLKHRLYLEQIGVVQEGEEVDEDEPKSKSKRSEKQQADESHRAKHKAEAIKLFNAEGVDKFFKKRSSSPPLSSWGQNEVAKPVKTFISSIMPDTIKEWTHKTGEYLGKTAEKSTTSWQNFKQDPSIDNWSTKNAIRHGTFEALNLMGTGVDYLKSFARKGLRGVGMDANHAQDVVSVVEIAFVATRTAKFANGVIKGPKKVTFDDHLSFKGPNQPTNSNFMQGINSNVMPLQNKANGTFGNGYGFGMMSQGKQPTLQNLANSYGDGSLTKPKVDNVLTHRIGDSKIPEVGDGFGKAKVVNPLLPGEGKVGTYKDLLLKSHRGDNLTPNHMPQFAFMQKHGVKKSDGISMMMEQPVPGKGGRHRQTNTYGKKPDLSSNPRQELAKDLVDVKNIYKKDGVYTAEIKKGLLEVAEQNKQTFPELFKKVIE